MKHKFTIAWGKEWGAIKPGGAEIPGEENPWAENPWAENPGDENPGGGACIGDPCLSMKGGGPTESRMIMLKKQTLKGTKSHNWHNLNWT